MRRIVLGIVIIGNFSAGIAVANACGDKALRIGRGIRFQRTSTRQF